MDTQRVDSCDSESSGLADALEMSFNPNDTDEMENMNKQIKMIKEPLTGQKSSSAHIQAIQFIKEFE
jgi:hypothetical protein